MRDSEVVAISKRFGPSYEAALADAREALARVGLEVPERGALARLVETGVAQGLVYGAAAGRQEVRDQWAYERQMARKVLEDD